MSRQFVHWAVTNKRIAVFSFILAATLAMAISIAPGTAFAGDAKSADEPMPSDVAPAMIQTDAAALTQDGEGAAAEAPLAASTEEEVGIGQAGTTEIAGNPGEQGDVGETGVAADNPGEPSSAEGASEGAGVDVAAGNPGEQGDVGETGVAAGNPGEQGDVGETGVAAGNPGEPSSAEGASEEAGADVAAGNPGEPSGVEGGAVPRIADLAGEGAVGSGDVEEADGRDGERPANVGKRGVGAAPVRAGESDGAATYTVTVSADPYVGGMASGGGDYTEGQTVTVTATANEYYIFLGWSEDDELVSAAANYTFTADRNRTLIAMFDVQEFGSNEGGDPSSGPVYGNDEATLIRNGVLNNATIRLRPQGSYKQVNIDADGTGAANHVHLYDIGATSRFKLMQATENSYYITYYFGYHATKPHYEEYYYLYTRNNDTLAWVFVNGGDLYSEGRKEWRFYQLEDGTYWIQNVESGLYLSLYSLDEINKWNKLVQRSTRIKWEVEFVRGPMTSEDTRNELKEYDSYSFEVADGDSSVTVTSADWMSHLPDYAFLTDLSIPGVHDAGTCNVGPTALVWTEDNPYRSQQLYFDDLLTNGVRYFDLRLKQYNNHITVVHGKPIIDLDICKDRDEHDLTVGTVMDWTTAFLKAHPGETVILAIKDEAGTDESSQAIWEWFNSYQQNNRDKIYTGFGNPQLADVRGKIVLISRINDGVNGRTYHIDDGPGPLSRSWAICVRKWKTGDEQNHAPELSAATVDYEFWTQDAYHMKPDEKWEWVEGSILSDADTGVKGRHDDAVSRGKGAWVVSFTSTEFLKASDLSVTPLVCARNINDKLKQSAKLSTEADEYVGIVCVDFADEQMAQRIYAINYRVDLDNRRDQHPAFEGSYVQKTYGDDPFTYTATNEEDGGKISYWSNNANVATVDAKTGIVTIHGAGRVNLYADAAETNYYHSATAACVLEVIRAAVTVTAGSGDVLYGDAVVCTYAITGGSLKYEDAIDSLGIAATTEAVAGSNAGDYDVVLSGGKGNPNYDVTLVNGKLTINPRPVTVTVADGTATYSGSKQYGEVACSFANLLEGHTASITYTPSSGIDASATAYDNGAFDNDFAVVDSNGAVQTSNYSLVRAVPGKLAIGKRPVTFAGVSETKDYTGSEIEITGVEVGGLVSGHAHNVAFSAKGTDVGGPYGGTITGKDCVVIMSGDDDVTANYDIAVANGSLTIQQNPGMKLSVALGGGSFSYDGAAHALPEAAATNALSGVTVVEYSADGESWTGDLASLTATDVGDSCTVHVRASNPNYGNTAYGTAMLTIDPARATITVDSASKVQYESDPAFTGTVEGLAKAGDLGEVVYSRANGDEAPGSYKGVLTATYAPNPNYIVEIVKGDFTIRALLTARWLDALGNVLQSTDYAEGDPVPAYGGEEPAKASTAQYDYAFAGWDDGTAEGTVTTFSPLFDAAVRSYGISLDLAGGVLDGMTGAIVTNIEYGATFILPKPTRDGYQFLYWEGSHYNAGDKYLVEGAHTFTARWQKIADDTPGGSADATPASYTNGGVPEGTVKAATPETGDELTPLILALVIAALGSLLALCRLQTRIVKK